MGLEILGYRPFAVSVVKFYFLFCRFPEDSEERYVRLTLRQIVLCMIMHDNLKIQVLL